MSNAVGVVCVFAKVPAAGRVKTRLAAAIGEERATELARAFLMDTWQSVARLDGVRAVLVVDGDGALPPLEPEPVVQRQVDADLGGRMEHALSAALAGGTPWAIALGTDSPGLPSSLLDSGISALRKGADAVVGPTLDGGFYLLGLSRCPAGLLAGLPWSTPGTCSATLERLANSGMSTEVIDGWFDVDDAADLERLRAALAADDVAAPFTAQVLAS